ncbi:vacuolar-type H+-ATPase subunit H [Sedimentibacter acidaminivorans]|jgi:vacuolar-type H+-ATPase subunit H|uniref:Vacuolar-type H+-ATPase subunit H n=1 Tax=Sedimentibacter acidaminivorans TaxID=913099 RepID=A0ABS4GAZ4_9FIRM|nr:ATPase [Sedimentibacter acidaminivorans]MBP1924858.1 vacuolar-type H+-ATPase subunit H [Sedimentibacter acidaminivorans]
MDVLNLLEKIEDIVEDASKFPLSNKVMIDKEEVLEVINEIRLKLPDEINRASWVAKERQRILTEAQSEAEELIEKVKEQQKMYIEESEIAKQAKLYAKQIVEEAEQKANDMKLGAYSYSDDILSKLQDKIKDINNIIEDNRDMLKKM